MSAAVLRVFLPVLLLAAAVVDARAADAPKAAPLRLRVMTFNLRFASNQEPHAWPDRRPVMAHLVEKEAPDVMGTQEGLYGQLRDLAADLPAYDWIGLGREGGSRGEFMAIFYRRDRFEPVAYDHFWLSDTPDVIGSATWGNHYRRMVTWVRLRERATGREFYYWNTHLDNEVEIARQKAAELIRERLATMDASVPLILGGDFNCAASASRAYEILTKDTRLTDTWTAADKRVNDGLNTFHNYEAPVHGGERIDWILARDPRRVTQAEIVTYQKNGQSPSDHFPVLTDLEF